MWGSSVPILQSLAIKVLSQPCSFLTVEKNWSSLEATNKKRDHLETMRFQDLLYVRMNLHLRKTIAKIEKVDLKPIDVDKIEAFPDDLEEFDLLEYKENQEEDVDETENEAGTQSDANGFSFSGIS